MIFKFIFVLVIVRTSTYPPGDSVGPSSRQAQQRQGTQEQEDDQDEDQPKLRTDVDACESGCLSPAIDRHEREWQEEGKVEVEIEADDEVR